MKYSFSPPTRQQYILNSMSWHTFGTLMISDIEIFWIARFASPYKAVFIKLTFEKTSADWAKQMSCSVSECYMWYSKSLLSTDKSEIYTLFGYYQTSSNSIYFSSFQTSDGTVIGNRYKSSTWSSNYGVYGSVLNGDNIVATLFCASWNLVIYNIPNSTFTFRLFSGSSLNDWEVENGSNR